MGVYIRGMEMPKKYPVTVTIFPDGITIAKTISGRRFTATAIPVKPHGRLVDARYIRDAIIQKWMDKAGDSHMYKCGMEDAYEVIRNAPTIIPAEEGET